MAKYTFGDDDSAVERLALVASAYEASSRAFIWEHAPSRVGVALDLGCGPAFSTKLLGEACSPEKLVGIDSSPRFLAAARERVAQAEFHIHDVTTVPLPAAPADVVYARLLLAHLPDPLHVAELWRGQLSPSGVLLIEDLEDIEAPAGPLRTYDEVSAEIVRAGGGVMYAGATLAPLGGSSNRVTVSAQTAARIYLFNVKRWIADAEHSVPELRLRSLEWDLEEISSGARTKGDEVSWIVRRLALRP